jgi:uncharacterized membrane protein YidH (DUF202 family)
MPARVSPKQPAEPGAEPIVPREPAPVAPGPTPPTVVGPPAPTYTPGFVYAQYAVAPSRPYNPWAIVSIAFASSTIIGTWCIGGLVAVITGHVARSQIKRSGEQGDGLALAGLIIGYLSIGLTLAFIAVYVLFVIFFIALAASHAGSSPSPTP